MTATATATEKTTEKRCAECGRCEPEPGRNECQLCHALLLGKAAVSSGWTQSEYPQFIGLLRESQTLGRFVAESREHGAHTCVRVGCMLLRLVHCSGVHDGEFTRALCALLNRDHLEFTAIGKTPDGLDGWKKRASLALAESWARVVEKGRKTLKPVRY